MLFCFFLPLDGDKQICYQKLIERLTWLENRHSTLGESNLIENIQSGFICCGQNWKGMDVVDKINVGEPPSNPTKIVTFRKA